MGFLALVQTDGALLTKVLDKTDTTTSTKLSYNDDTKNFLTANNYIWIGKKLIKYDSSNKDSAESKEAKMLDPNGKKTFVRIFSKGIVDADKNYDFSESISKGITKDMILYVDVTPVLPPAAMKTDLLVDKIWVDPLDSEWRGLELKWE